MENILKSKSKVLGDKGTAWGLLKSQMPELIAKEKIFNKKRQKELEKEKQESLKVKKKI